MDKIIFEKNKTEEFLNQINDFYLWKSEISKFKLLFGLIKWVKI